MTLFYINSKAYPRDFINRLRGVYRTRFIANANRKRLSQIEEQVKQLYNKSDIRLYDICLSAISNAIIIENNESYICKVDQNSKVQGICVASLLSLIDAGSLDIPAYPIFSTIERMIESDIESFYQSYQMGMLL